MRSPVLLISLLSSFAFAQEAPSQTIDLPSSTFTVSSATSSQDLVLSSLSARILSVSASIASVRSSSAMAPGCTGKFSWCLLSGYVFSACANELV
jgi:hypothetical protein